MSIPSLRAIVTAMCHALARQPPRFYIPIAPVRWVVALVEDVLALPGYATPINRATLEKYLEEIRVDGSRLQHELGFKPSYTLSVGWQEVVQQQWYNRGISP